MQLSLKLRHKVIVGYLAAGLVATVIAVLAYLSFDNVLTNFRGFINASGKAQMNLILSRDVSEIQRQALIYTYEGHPSAAEQVHTLYRSMMQALDDDQGGDHAVLISEHLKAYMQAFAQLQQQRELQYLLIHRDFRRAAANAEAFLRQHMQQKAFESDTLLLEDERLINTLLLIERDAMHYFDSLDPSYIKRVKHGFSAVRMRMQAMDAHLTGRAKAQGAKHNIDEFERVFLEAVQRTRGYLFLVNVVMSAEAYEVLYNARKMSEHVSMDMEAIEQDTYAMLRSAIESVVAAIALSLLFVVLLSFLIARNLIRPVVGLTTAFNALSQGAYDTAIPAYHADDEIGDLTLAATVFKEKNLQMSRLLEQSEALTAEVKERETRFRRLVKQVPIPLAYVTKTGVFEFFNDRFIQTFGYTQEDLPTIEQWWQRAYPDESYRKWVMSTWEAATREAVTRHEDIQPMEYNVTCKTGEVRIIEISGVFLGDDLLATCIDLSERKQAEEKVRRYYQAMEQSGEAMVIADAEGVIEHVNPAFTLITGYAEAEAVGRRTSLLKSGNQDAGFYEKLWDTIAYGQTWQGKVINRKKSGDYYPAMLTISPIRNDEGKITHYIGVQKNLEQFEALEAQLRQAQKMEAVGTLVGGIAHDFNNTLAGITGNLYLAKKAAGSLPDVMKRLDVIETLSFSAASTIQQLLAFSRKGRVEMQPLSIEPFLKETIKLQQVSLPENIVLLAEVNGSGMRVKGDINQLQQVLMNLINNAIDALQACENPTIHVRLDHFHADRNFAAQYDGFNEGEYACIAVTDNGQGIKPEHIEHVFEPFFTTKEQGKGTGLGLAMVYGTVKTHGGVVEVKSSPAGTTIQLYLPLITTAEVVGASGLSDAIMHGQGETILLVDDNEMVLETGRDVLEGLGYAVLTATDGLSAIEVYQTHRDKIDLLILDVVMPGLGGVEALQAIRDINPDVKAMFATGYDKLRTLGETVNEAGEKVISKPFAVGTLSQSIREVLDHGDLSA